MVDIDPRPYENTSINDDDIHNIILSYLVHNCYKDTVDSFITTMTADHSEGMEKRKHRSFSVGTEGGDALKAIELTKQLVPDLLNNNNDLQNNNKDLQFDLLSLHFVELVCSRKCTEAVEFARAKLTPFGNVYVEKLEDFMALLAYEEPEKSPMFHLLSLDYRQHVAECLNRAMHKPTYPAIQQLNG